MQIDVAVNQNTSLKENTLHQYCSSYFIGWNSIYYESLSILYCFWNSLPWLQLLRVFQCSGTQHKKFHFFSSFQNSPFIKFQWLCSNITNSRLPQWTHVTANLLFDLSLLKAGKRRGTEKDFLNIFLKIIIIRFECWKILKTLVYFRNNTIVIFL